MISYPGPDASSIAWHNDVVTTSPWGFDNYSFSAQFIGGHQSTYAYDQMAIFTENDISGPGAYNGFEVGVWYSLQTGYVIGYVQEPSAACCQSTTVTQQFNLFTNDNASHSYDVLMFRNSAQFFVDGKLKGQIVMKDNSAWPTPNYLILTTHKATNFNSGSDFMQVSNIVLSQSVDPYDSATPDPSTVATSTFATNYAITGISYNHHIFLADGLYWAFYQDGTNYGCRTSSDGVNWSAETTIISGASNSYSIDLWLSGTTIAYYRSGGTTTEHYRYGTLSASGCGSISWTIADSTFASTNNNVAVGSMSEDSSGNIWLAIPTLASTIYHLEVWQGTSCGGSGCTWAKSTDVTLSTTAVNAQILTSGSSNVAFLWGPSGGTIGALNVETSTNSGSSWSSASATSSTSYLFGDSESAIIGSNVYAATTDGNHVFALSFPFGGSWSSATQIDSGLDAVMSTDGNYLYMMYEQSSTTVNYVYSVTSGTSWSTPTVISSSESNIVQSSLSTTSAAISLQTPLVWTEGTASPFSVVFAPVAQIISNTFSEVPASVGNPILVDGTSYTPSQTLYLSYASNHQVNAPSTIKWSFSSWSDGGAQSHSITIGSSPTTYTATFALSTTCTNSNKVSGTSSNSISLVVVIPLVMIVGFICMGLMMFLGRDLGPLVLVSGIVMVGVVIVAIIAIYLVAGSVATSAGNAIVQGGC